MAPSPFKTPGTRNCGRLGDDEGSKPVRFVGKLAGSADFGHFLAVELVQNAFERAVLGERVLANERFGPDSVDADVLGVSRGDQKVAVRRIADGSEELSLHVVLRSELVGALPTACEIATTVDSSLHLGYALDPLS